MSNEVFLAALIGGPVVLGLCDLYERWRMPPERERAAASAGGVLFLGVVLAVYVGIQGLAGRLAPGPREVVARVSGALGGGADGAAGWAIALGVLVGLYAGGLADYLMHRWVSHARAFWVTHEYHHLPNEVFLLMPGLAARPFAVVASFPVTVATAGAAYGTLALCGQPLGTATPMQWLLIMHVMLLVTSHSSFLRRFRAVHVWMKRFGLTTAREHLLHHTTDLAGNFANLTTVWDRVFGTYLDPDVVSMEGRRLGLAYDQDWLGAVTLSLLKLPPRWRARFDVGRWCNLGS